MIKLQNISNSNIIINSPNSVITLTNTIDAINSIKDYSTAEKDELIKKITELSTYQNNKSKFWEKSKNILTWIVDKGAETAIAILPYILENLH